MKRKWIVAALGAALFSAAAWGQMGPGMGGYGMGGYGMGGYGMGGYGMGPGMMGGAQGGANCQGIGPGMMGAGVGRGMIGGMGQGMMGGPGWGYESLGLSDAQREKIAAIAEELRDKHWGLMRSMHELRWKNRPGTQSDADALKDYDATAAIQREMFTARLDARKRMEEVLTKEQREELRKQQRRGW